MEDPNDPSAQAPDHPGESAAEQIARLREELTATREEVEQLRERWMRERADLENVRKRADRERGDAIRYGTERLVGDLLPVFDNLERAIRSAEQGAGGPGLLEGVRLVAKALSDVLARHGVTRVEAVGHAFDPNHHEAVAHLEHDAHRTGMVIEEHRGGFRLNDRLLRPALVSVSKGPRGGDDLAKPEGRD
jgi:molecular chaperone GrpE